MASSSDSSHVITIYSTPLHIVKKLYLIKYSPMFAYDQTSAESIIFSLEKLRSIETDDIKYTDTFFSLLKPWIREQCDYDDVTYFWVNLSFKQIVDAYNNLSLFSGYKYPGNNTSTLFTPELRYLLIADDVKHTDNEKNLIKKKIETSIEIMENSIPNKNKKKNKDNEDIVVEYDEEETKAILAVDKMMKFNMGDAIIKGMEDEAVDNNDELDEILEDGDDESTMSYWMN